MSSEKQKLMEICHLPYTIKTNGEYCNSCFKIIPFEKIVVENKNGEYTYEYTASEENISNLESVNGTLVVRWEGKNDRHYIRYLNGKETEFNFSLANLLRNINLRSYDGKAVVLWHKNRYVYQMETVEGEIVFSVDSANRAVCANNQIQALLYILLFVGWLLRILCSISERNGEMDENR